MGLAKLRKEVYSFFDNNIKPIIMENEGTKDSIVERCEEAAAKFTPKMMWIIKCYGDTIRASAHSSAYGYQFFMIATPEGKEEHDFGKVKYHGSRKKVNNENSNYDKQKS